MFWVGLFKIPPETIVAFVVMFFADVCQFFRLHRTVFEASEFVFVNVFIKQYLCCEEQMWSTPAVCPTMQSIAI